jgi:hypothetical protein
MRKYNFLLQLNIEEDVSISRYVVQEQSRSCSDSKLVSGASGANRSFPALI